MKLKDVKKKSKRNKDICMSIDISSIDTGVAIYDGEFKYGHIQGKGDGYNKCTDIADGVVDMLHDYIGDLSAIKSLSVVVEQPFFIPGKSFPKILFLTHGCILYALFKMCAFRKIDFNWDEVNVSRWRNWFCGKLKPKENKKQAVINKVKEVYGFAVENDNVADALGLMRYFLNEAGVKI